MHQDMTEEEFLQVQWGSGILWHPFVLQVVPCEGDESVGLLSRLELGTGFTLDCNEDLRTPGDPCVRVLR